MRLWRVQLQCRQAAEMFTAASLPPSDRGTRCSAVHFSRAAAGEGLAYSQGSTEGEASHIATPQ